MFIFDTSYLITDEPVILSTSTRRIGTYINNPDPIYLRCLTDAVPPPYQYKWNGPGEGLQVGETATHIIQTPTKDSQFGKYVCTASNTAGFARHTVEVVKIG